MILPIYGYGHPVLKKVAKPIGPDYPELEKLIADMWDTMYNASGVGLAAPQIGKSIRLFIVDTKQSYEEEEGDKGIRQVFINPERIDETGEPWLYEEGCLSIPDIRGDVERPERIRLRWLDEQFQPHEAEFDGLEARVIQHEYDHLEGVLFVEKLANPLKRKLIKRKLDQIRRGRIQPSYRMVFAERR